MPFGNAVLLLLYLLPGFLAMQLYRARYPAKHATQFEITIWSVLHSFAVHLGLAGVALVVGRPDFALLNQDRADAIQPETIGVLLTGGFLWGCILIAYHWMRIKVSFLPTPDPQAIWPVVAAGSPDDELWVLVRTKQGTHYVGWIDQYSFDPASSDHDFLLLPAYLVGESPDEVLRDLTKGGVYLNTRDVEAIERIPGK